MIENRKAIANDRMAKMNADLLDGKLSYKIIQSMSMAYVQEIRNGGSVAYLRALLQTRREDGLAVAGSAIDFLGMDQITELQDDFENLLFGDTEPVLLWALEALGCANVRLSPKAQERLKLISEEPYQVRIRTRALEVLSEMNLP